MTSEPITFFDIPSKDRTPWSFNPWKTRFLLNYKGLNHKTEWVEYPDIKTRLEGHIPSQEPGSLYTVPTIKLPSGTYIMDGKRICEYITTTYPSPPLPGLESPAYTKLIDIMNDVLNKSFGIFVPLVPKRILGPASQEYWYRTREKEDGPLDELWETQGGEIGWDKTEPSLRAATALLKENPEGPFILGKQVSYADFCWAGFILFTKALGEDVHEELLKRSGDGRVHLNLVEAVGPWAEVK